MSKSILILCPYPFDSVGSQRFRHELYLEALRKAGYVVEIAPFWNSKEWNIQQTSGKSWLKFWSLLKALTRRAVLIFQLKPFDILYIHREVIIAGPPWFEWIVFRFYKHTIIYDYDDALWLADSIEEAWWKSMIKWRSKIAYTIRQSHLVFAGNSYLAENARRYNSTVIVLPTVVDTHIFNYAYTPSLTTIPVVGWTGTHSTLKYLEQIGPQLKEVYNQIPFILRVICNVPPEFEFENLQYIEWNKETESLDLEGITLGLMPLPEDDWTKGKCGFKAIQYMAKGIPTLASAVGVNKDLLSGPYGGGLVYSYSEWKSILLQWLSRDFELLEHSLAARKVIETKYSKQVVEGQFLQSFKELL